MQNINDSVECTPEKLEYFAELKKKSNKDQHHTLILYLITLNTAAALSSLSYLEKLDKLLNIHIDPRGKIGVMGVLDGLIKYKEFRDA